ncbi:MAG: hypothetical protein ACRD68_10050, partial [Pyrinomonadaceae bacterium]
AATAPTRELLRAAEDLGVELRPLDAGADSPALSRYFTVEVPNREAAERVVARLRRCGAVEAAYLKPPDEMP